jgi:hypothetical protein
VPDLPAPSPGAADHPGTEVTAKDLLSGESGRVVISDDYVLITDGTCQRTHVQVHGDGTHVITVKGAKRRA